MPEKKYRYTFFNRRYLQDKVTGETKVEEYVFLDFVDKQPIYVNPMSLHDISIIPEYDFQAILELMHEAQFRESRRAFFSSKYFQIAETWDLAVIIDGKIIEMRKGGCVIE